MTTLILHGIMGHAGENWATWLKDELEKEGHKVLVPNLSNADKPDRNSWLQEIKKIVEEVKPDQLTIVAHSLSVTSALDFIEGLNSKLYKLVSVSGFAIPYGLELNEYFLQEKTINFDAIKENLTNAAVLYGDDDPYVSQEALQSLAGELSVDAIVMPRGGHLNSAAGYDTFPELLKCCID